METRLVRGSSYDFGLTALFMDVAAHDDYPIDLLYAALNQGFRPLWARD